MHRCQLVSGANGNINAIIQHMVYQVLCKQPGTSYVVLIKPLTPYDIFNTSKKHVYYGHRE